MSTIGAPPSVTREQAQRLLYRCISEVFISAVEELGQRFNGDFVQGLVFTALTEDAKVPEADRPGQSIRGIASSLGIPAETLRRQMGKLIDSGLATRLPSGRYTAVPSAVNSSAELVRHERSVEILAATLKKLSVLGYANTSLDGELGKREPKVALLIGHAFDSFILRCASCGPTVHGDLTNTAIFIALVYLNSKHIAFDPLLAWKYSGRDTPPPEGSLIPALGSKIAQALGLPEHAVRRRLVVLSRLERCERVRGGYIARRDFLENPDVLRLGLLSGQYFEKMLGELGVLQGVREKRQGKHL